MSLILRLNLTIFLVFLAIFIGVFFKVLYTTAGHLHQESLSSFDLTNQMADSQIELIKSYPYVEVRPERKLSLFHIEQFDDIKYIKVELYDSYNNLSASNLNGKNYPSLPIPDSIKHALTLSLFEPIESVSRSIDIGSMHLGMIVISPDNEAKIRDLWFETLSTLSPIIVLLIIISLGMVVVSVIIIKPVLEFVRAVNSPELLERSPSSGLSRMSHLLRLPKYLQGIHHGIQDSSQQVHDLNNKILHLQEEERRRLSAELHDELGQHLTAIRFEAAVIKTAKNLEDTLHSAEAIDTIGREMKDIVRSMLERLRPPELDMFGLQGAITEMISEWQLRHPQIKIEFKFKAKFSDLDEAKKLSIYRIVQEGLTNISRHANSSALDVVISLISSDGLLTILISDNGQGCDLTTHIKGFGLKGMRERVNGLLGSMTLDSSPDKGMKIIVEVPIKGESKG